MFTLRVLNFEYLAGLIARLAQGFFKNDLFIIRPNSSILKSLGDFNPGAWQN